MLRSNRRVKRHMELLQLLIVHPVEGREAVRELSGSLDVSDITQRQEKTLIKSIKERVNGSNHSR